MRKNIGLFIILTIFLSITTYFSSWFAVMRGTLGISFFILLAYLLSKKKSSISWRLILQCVILQLIGALAVLKIPFLDVIFQNISENFIQIIGFSKKGAQFLLASFISGEIESPIINFMSVILPSILFFSALTSILYHYHIIQKFVYFLAFLTKNTLKISGAESLAVSASIFLGQTESGLLIRHYIPKMNRSEIMLFMTSGMATVSGSVMATYIYFLAGDDPIQQAFCAKHFMVASFISVPAAILMAKILVPQQEEILNNSLTINEQEDTSDTIVKEKSNLLTAIADGTADGLRLAVNIAAMLLVIISLLAFINEFILTGIIGKYTGINDWISLHTNYTSLSLEFMLAYILAPFVYMMGVTYQDVLPVAQLIGEKTVLNEFVAYASLGKMKAAKIFIEPKSIIIATYVLCGFSNFSSIGIQISGIGALVPEKKKMLSQLGLKALLAASLACILTGVIAGMMFE